MKRIRIQWREDGKTVYHPGLVGRYAALVNLPQNPAISLLESKPGLYYTYRIKSGRIRKGNGKPNTYTTTLIKDPATGCVYSECICSGGQVPILCWHVALAVLYQKETVRIKRDTQQKLWNERPQRIGDIDVIAGNFVIKIYNPYPNVIQVLRALSDRHWDDRRNTWELPTTKENIVKVRTAVDKLGLHPTVQAASMLSYMDKV